MIGLIRLATCCNPCCVRRIRKAMNSYFLFSGDQICATGSKDEHGRGERGVVHFYPNRQRLFKSNVR